MSAHAASYWFKTANTRDTAEKENKRTMLGTATATEKENAKRSLRNMGADHNDDNLIEFVVQTKRAKGRVTIAKVREVPYPIHSQIP